MDRQLRGLDTSVVVKHPRNEDCDGVIRRDEVGSCHVKLRLTAANVGCRKVVVI